MSEEKQIEEMDLAVLNCYRNKYYTDGNRTEQGIIANAINEVLPILVSLKNGDYRKMPSDMGELSGGYHTFNELYHHRAVLFLVICHMFPEKAWKSKLHDTGDMYDGMFIVGIETEQGQATYHYDIDPYWDMFKVKELERAPKWDGHTPSDAIVRIGGLAGVGRRKGRFVLREGCKSLVRCTACGYEYSDVVECTNFCGECGADMRGGEE